MLAGRKVLWGSISVFLLLDGAAGSVISLLQEISVHATEPNKDVCENVAITSLIEFTGNTENKFSTLPK